MLCTVTEQTLMLGASEGVKAAIKKYFNRCRSLNQARVIVAHGSWTLDGARQVSRGDLQAGFHFRKPAEIDVKADKAKALMGDIFQLGATHR